MMLATFKDNFLKKIFIIFWFFLVLTPLITIFRGVNLSQNMDSIFFLSSFQRLTGMISYVILGMQIILGANMEFFMKLFGSKVFKLHINQGLIGYGFIFVHPLLNSLIVYRLTLNLTQVFLTLIPSFKTEYDLFLAFGKIGFAMITIAVFSALLRERYFLRKNWRLFHRINYPAFIFVFLHSGIGSDKEIFPFSVARFLVFFAVLFCILRKVLLVIKDKIYRKDFSFLKSN